MSERREPNPENKYSRELAEKYKKDIDQVRKNIRYEERYRDSFKSEAEKHKKIYKKTHSVSRELMLDHAEREVEYSQERMKNSQSYMDKLQGKLQELVDAARDEAIKEEDIRQVERLQDRYETIIKLEPKVGPLVDPEYQTREEREFDENLHGFLDDLSSYFEKLDKKDQK